jgi:hypothetical protein
MVHNKMIILKDNLMNTNKFFLNVLLMGLASSSIHVACASNEQTSTDSASWQSRTTRQKAWYYAKTYGPQLVPWVIAGVATVGFFYANYYSKTAQEVQKLKKEFSEEVADTSNFVSQIDKALGGSKVEYKGTKEGYNNLLNRISTLYIERDVLKSQPEKKYDGQKKLESTYKIEGTLNAGKGNKSDLKNFFITGTFTGKVERTEPYVPYRSEEEEKIKN